MRSMAERMVTPWNTGWRLNNKYSIVCSRMLDHPPRHLQARPEMNENEQFVIRHSADKYGKRVDPVLHLVKEMS
jgi:hypothetical protein